MAEHEGDGLRCPYCGCRDLPVSHTRPAPRGKTKRVRYCRNCHSKVVTREEYKP